MTSSMTTAGAVFIRQTSSYEDQMQILPISTDWAKEASRELMIKWATEFFTRHEPGESLRKLEDVIDSWKGKHEDFVRMLYVRYNIYELSRLYAGPMGLDSARTYQENSTRMIDYEGQNYGLADKHLIELVEKGKPIHVFVSKGREKTYDYLGSTFHSYIIRNRTQSIGEPSQSDERLCVRLLLPTNRPIMVRHDTVYAKNCDQSSKCKHDCLAFLGVREYKTGVSTAVGKECCRNLSIGIFRW